jgi:hypothetical protein
MEIDPKKEAEWHIQKILEALEIKTGRCVTDIGLHRFNITRFGEDESDLSVSVEIDLDRKAGSKWSSSD